MINKIKQKLPEIVWPSTLKWRRQRLASLYLDILKPQNVAPKDLIKL